jgi:hypothetical protein
MVTRTSIKQCTSHPPKSSPGAAHSRRSRSEARPAAATAGRRRSRRPCCAPRAARFVTTSGATSGDGCAGPERRVWAGMRYPSEQLCTVSAADRGAGVQFARKGFMLGPSGHFLRRFTAPRKRNCLRAVAPAEQLIIDVTSSQAPGRPQASSAARQPRPPGLGVAACGWARQRGWT